MILHFYKHKGSVAFPEEITVDFDALPPVVGLMGRNGAGKTSFLDTLVAAFYLQMPFRPDPLHQQFATRGYIDVVWSRVPGGKRYRSRVNVDPEAGRTEAVLYPAEGGKALAGPLQRNYLAEIGRLLGPLDLFLCSAYTTQQSYTSGRSAMTFLLADRAARRGVMSDLLELSTFGLKQASARDRIKAVETKLNGLQSLAKQWQAELERQPVAVKAADDLVVRLAGTADALEALQKEAEAAQEALRDAKARRQALVPQQQALDVAIAELNRLRHRDRELADAIAVAEDAIRAAQAAAHAPAERDRLVKELAALPVAENTLKTVTADLLALETELEGTIERAQAADRILVRAPVIEEAQESLKGIDQELAELERAYERQMMLDSEAATAYRDWLSTRNDLQRACVDRDRIEAQTQILDRVPCQGQEAFAGCQFLLDAAAARSELPALAARVATLEEQVGETREAPAALAPLVKQTLDVLRDSRARVAAVAAEAAALQAAQTRRDELHDQANGLNDKIRDKRVRRDEVEAEIRQLTPLKQALDMLTPLIPVAMSLTGHEATLKAKKEERAHGMVEIGEKEQVRDRLQEALVDVPKLAEQIRLGDIAAFERATTLRAAQTIVTQLTKDATTAQAKVQALDEVQRRFDETRAQIGPLQTDLDDWTLLAKALSPAGIPALLVDQALPEISALATDMLRECFGEAVFTISLTTQKTSADDKKLLEVLDVLILRNGRETAVANLSGGEGVLVSEAISLAIAILKANRDKETRPYTLFRDEVGANLDDERAPAYTRLLARAVKMGGFDRVLFVSHHQRALDLAEARLVIEDGQVKVA